MLAEIRDKALNGKRLGRDEGRWLLTEAPLLEVGALASEVRFARIPDTVVTFVIDSNPNYTNVCVTDCQFCAFYRKPGDPEAYTLTVEEVLAKVAFAAGKGATTVLLQGGHNPALPLEYYTTLVRETRRRFPQVTPHFFTASEIQTIAEVSRLTVGGVLDRLWEAGQRTLPGGPPARLQVHGDDDVRPRRAARRPARPPRRDPGTPGRGGRLHRIRAVVVQAGPYAAGEVGQAGEGPERLFEDARGRASLPRQRPAHPGLVVLRGQADGPDRAPLRRRRLGRHALRGERPQGGRLRQHDHRRGDHGPDPRGRLHARPAHHDLRDSQNVLVG